MTATDPDVRLAEALLFAATEPLADETIASRFPDGVDVEALMARVVEAYAGRGINVVRVAGKWALRTAPDLVGALRLETHVPRKLSRAAVETLAIIAYHQPVTRAEVEEIRGVALSRGTLEILMEVGWIRPKGHRETPGRPATWVTTEQFLAHFGLDTTRDLPGVEELKAAGLLNSRPVLSEIGGIGEAAPEPSDDEPAPEAADVEPADPDEVPPAAADGRT